jgi:hypothetical protein
MFLRAAQRLAQELELDHHPVQHRRARAALAQILRLVVVEPSPTLGEAILAMVRRGRGSRMPPGQWSRHFERCQRCGTTQHRHVARGYCKICYPKRPATEWPVTSGQ